MAVLCTAVVLASIIHKVLPVVHIEHSNPRGTITADRATTTNCTSSSPLLQTTYSFCISVISDHSWGSVPATNGLADNHLQGKETNGSL